MFRYLWTKTFTPRLTLPQRSYIGRGVSIWSKKGGKIECKGKVRLDKETEVGAAGPVTLGHHFVLNPYSRIVALEGITIGDHVTIARFVSVLDHDHAFSSDGHDYNTAPIHIGHNVWLGDKVTVLKGVSIGDNVTIAANSVVTKDIPANTVAGGVPAKVIKTKPSL